jgi:Periplasmic binding protein
VLARRIARGRTGALGVVLLAVALSAPSAGAASSTRGVTRRTIVVGGILGDATSKGAEIGAQARFARANARGGVGGRTIEFRGAAVVDDPAVGGFDAHVAELTSEVFAFVPALGDQVNAASLARNRLPFFGVADPTWAGNRFGFSFVGVSGAAGATAWSPAWGLQLRALLGPARGLRIAILVDDDPAGTVQADATRRALRQAGFAVDPPIRVSTASTPAPDLATIASTLVAGNPAGAVVLTSPAVAIGVGRALTGAGYTGTVAVGESFYVPSTPDLASGLSVLVPYAPIEARTAATRRMVADVEAFAPDTAVTPAIAAGYWSADLFLAVLAKVGRRLTLDRFLAVANGGKFRYEVPATVGRSTWPAMHSQAVPCGALLQSDATRYLVTGPFACGTPITVKTGGARKRRSG